MGKIKKGILGGFSGRVGNVIGGSWKGIDYMRSEATSISDPKTTKQLAQRSKFRVAVEFAKGCVPVVNIGLKQYATKRSEFNYLVSKICKDWWDDANDHINYPLVQLSAGDLPSEDFSVQVTSDPSGSVLFGFSWASDQPDYSTNKIVACAYCIDNSEWVFTLPFGNTAREDGAIDLLAPASWEGSNYCFYLFFVDVERNKCSPTSFYIAE